MDQLELPLSPPFRLDSDIYNLSIINSYGGFNPPTLLDLPGIKSVGSRWNFVPATIDLYLNFINSFGLGGTQLKTMQYYSTPIPD